MSETQKKAESDTAAEMDAAGEYESYSEGMDISSEGLEALSANATQPPPQNAVQEREHIERLERDIEKHRDQILRAMAETENLRRRAVKEREDAAKFAITGFARDLLSVSDNLRRALDAFPPEMVKSDERIKGLLSGIEATERELLSVYERNGIKKLEPLHHMFDPNLHEVMFEAPIQGLPPGTVFQVMQPGYVLNDRLLRPARVGVVKEAPQQESQSQKPPPEPGSNIDTEA